MSEETLSFQAEVSKLLDIVVHSLYSDRQIFLRELISNASDACDKLRYEALTHPGLLEGESAPAGEGEGGGFAIQLSVDPKARTLTLADNGIGMNRDELVENLGTIARSGTQAFLETLKAKKEAGAQGKGAADPALIGQFGVGFYSAFMVADKVEVLTRRAGDSQGWRWTSDGSGHFTIGEAEGVPRGATITLHLREDAAEFLEEYRLRHIVRTYSDHIAIPVLFHPPAKEEGEDKEGEADEGPRAPETLNEASALWTRPRDQITEEQYAEFYRHVSHNFDSPWHTLHYRAEGVLEYTGLLFMPSSRPHDLFAPERKTSVKLYVNRVFISDDCKGLLPAYLRFVRGIVDSSDLPLNVSREMLQEDPRLHKIKSGLTKRLLDDLAKRARDNEDDYLSFWASFGAVLKEGIYEDFERKEDIAKLARFRTTASTTPVSLETVIDRMKEGQEALYYVTGDDADALARSPQVEGFLARGIEVLLLTDPIDEFWVNAMPTVLGKPLKAVAQAGSDLDALPLTDEAEAKEGNDGAADKAADKTPASDDALDRLIAAVKQELGDGVADVRRSARLTGSPVCLVAQDGALSPHLRRLLQQVDKDSDLPDERVLEVNPKHPVIKALAVRAQAEGASDDGDLKEAAHLLLDQARILEGEPPRDPIAFAHRMTTVLGRILVG